MCVILVFSLGHGAITSNQVTLSLSSFLTDPPIFTLAGETSGGPPVNYAWTRGGEEVTRDISISVKESDPAKFRDSLYVSVLVVIGRYPGEYAYIVSNKATTSNVSASFTIEGNQCRREGYREGSHAHAQQGSVMVICKCPSEVQEFSIIIALQLMKSLCCHKSTK